jgi:hypothetical protein
MLNGQMPNAGHSHEQVDAATAIAVLRFFEYVRFKSFQKDSCIFSVQLDNGGGEEESGGEEETDDDAAADDEGGGGMTRSS